jgi:hypothetical protein
MAIGTGPCPMLLRDLHARCARDRGRPSGLLGLPFSGRHHGRRGFPRVLVPGEALVVFGGVLAASGSLKLGAAPRLPVSGAILGGSLGYELGRPWLLRYGR